MTKNIVQMNEELKKKVNHLQSELDRLLAGNFTPEEFQNLCHNLHENPNCTKEDFKQGCREFTIKLFGDY